MTSIKRLLNPSEDPSTYPQLRDFQSEDVPNDEPLLQEQTWGGLFNELFSADGLEGESGEVFTEDPVCYDAETIESWTAENVFAASSSTPPLAPADEVVCYGMIHRTPVKLHGVMAELVAKMREENEPLPGHCALTVAKKDDHIAVIFNDKSVFGEPNTHMSEVLLKLLERDSLIFEVIANVSNTFETIGKAEKANDAVVRVDINIYGPRSVGKELGQQLSKNKVYLQRPNYRRNNSEYDNPHFLKLPDVQVNDTGSFFVPTVGLEKKADLDKEEEFKRTIGSVYASLTRNRKLHGLEGDDRLKTRLLPHQKEALEFMIQREQGPIPEEYQLWKPCDIEGQPCYRHLVTKAIARVPQSELGGGILADEMGMGKTLSILSLILNTLGAGHEWSNSEPSSADPTAGTKLRSRGTLIVASSALMINEWFQEIELHLDDQLQKELKLVKYHGQYRDTDIELLRNSDIVVTTYHTLAADFASKKGNPLNEIYWYRIVLDEAHIIRRQATTLNQTASKLWAKSRWCLTGTPIQNRLDDIGSLFAFIRLRPFERISTFRRCISAPFDDGADRKRIAIEAFTRLLDSTCLRRTLELIHLPEKHERTHLVKFSPEERNQYEQTKAMMFRAIRHQPGVFDRKSTLGMFQTQLQLRILCNHGTYQDPFSWARRSILDEREFLASTIRDYRETICSSCKQSMPIVGSNAVYRNWPEKCSHVLCTECIEESTQAGVDSITHCPLCHPIWASSSVPLDQSKHMMKKGEVDTYFRPQGHSSKMEALIADLQADLSKTKGIIFSCWTRTLNLIERYLKEANICCERIDGECPLTQRQNTLNKFAKDPDLRILIMTTGTGAVGLNLTSANRVFIVEPQWNPSVENQAIARALRLGQHHSVHVTRYVVESTVEQDMRTQQDVKRSMAELAGSTRN
jgi:SNF2 family DNA or RNA helicase